MSRTPSAALLPAQIAILTSPQSLPTLALISLRFAVMVTKWDQHKRSRRLLNRLDPHQLHDIGLSRGAASAEADKPFWRD